MKTYIVYLGIGLLLLSACTRDSQSDEEPSLDTTQTQPIDETKPPQSAEQTQPIDDTKPPQSAEQSQKDLQLAEQEFDKANQELLSNMDKLQQTVKGSYPLLNVEVPLSEPHPITLEEYYTENVSKVAQKIVEAKYTPHELALIKRPKQVLIEDIPYQFQSPEGDFLEKIQALYLKVYNVHPYHEQGRIARALVLLSLEVADVMEAGQEQESVTKKISSAEQDTATAEKETTEEMRNSAYLPYQIAESLMLNVDNSFFEESELFEKEGLLIWGQSIYAVFSGKHFLTGRTLTDFERAIWTLESALSYLNPPILNQISIKDMGVQSFLNALRAIDLLSQIREKESAKSDSNQEGGLISGDGAVLDKARAILSILESEKDKNLQKTQEKLDFLKKHFSGQDPTQQEMAQALKPPQNSH